MNQCNQRGFAKNMVLCCHDYIPGRWLPGAAAHGRPWPPVEFVQREGIPCASPAKLLYWVMHPACMFSCTVTQLTHRYAHREKTEKHLWTKLPCFMMQILQITGPVNMF